MSKNPRSPEILVGTDECWQIPRSGSVDELELFSRALNDAEVRELYAKGKPDL
jgi:hypothetical protein